MKTQWKGKLFVGILGQAPSCSLCNSFDAGQQNGIIQQIRFYMMTISDEIIDD